MATTKAAKVAEARARRTDRLTDVIAESIHKATQSLAAKIAALEQRIQELEQRGPSMKFCGPWHDTADGYALGDVVSRSGSSWHSDTAHNKTIPGVSGSLWTLMTKRGRDGKNANGERTHHGHSD